MKVPNDYTAYFILEYHIAKSALMAFNLSLPDTRELGLAISDSGFARERFSSAPS